MKKMHLDVKLTILNYRYVMIILILSYSIGLVASQN